MEPYEFVYLCIEWIDNLTTTPFREKTTDALDYDRAYMRASSRQDHKRASTVYVWEYVYQDATVRFTASPRRRRLRFSRDGVHISVNLGMAEWNECRSSVWEQTPISSDLTYARIFFS